MENQALDNELTSSSIVYAGFWRRVGASCIDFLIFIPVVFLSFVNSLNWKSYLLAIIFGASATIYKIIMEGTSGATIGKRAMSIKVVKMSGENISFADSVQRNSIYLISMLVALYTTYLVFTAENFADVTKFIDMSKFQKENGSNLANIFYGLIAISVLFVPFTAKKQALHDMIGKTLVIKTS